MSSALDKQRRGIGSSADSGLHAKTFAVDRRRIFVGSFNFNSLSARLNTEMGVVLDSQTLASQLSDLFANQVPRVTYEAALAADRQRIERIERTPAGAVRHTHSSDARLLRRMWVGLLSILPIEWVL